MTVDIAARIDAALAAGDVAAAVELSRQALAAGDRDPFTVNLVAWQQVEDGDAPGAEQLLRRALLQTPDDPGLLTTLGLALRRQSRLAEALRSFDAAIALAPAYPVAWLERGFALHQGNSLKAAQASYRQAAALDQGRAAALAGIAAIASTQGELAEARDFAGRALAVDPRDAVAHCALARCDIADGAAVAAVARLRALLAGPGVNLDNQSAAQSLLGDALAKLGEAQAAHDAWFAAKASLPARFPLLASAEPLTGMVARIDRAVLAGPDRWEAPPAAPGRGHAFLLGYPRSGTTLVETILATAEGVEALEEMPTLLAAETEFYLPADGPDRLTVIGNATAERFRSAYWQRVADYGIGDSARLFVDMDPLKSLDLPLIGRLFPHAAIVVMRRDPRDVILSCFRQNFAVSPIAFEFASLDRAARHYDALMQLQQHSLARMPNPVLELRYEALVADFDTVTQQLCAFLGVPWTEALRDFSETARRRNVNTASVAQVRRGLYNGGGQWQRFAAQLEPVLPALAPWIRAFGYPL
ncbi:MAG: sulfotransferase [Polymorphobacter sp.]